MAAAPEPLRRQDFPNVAADYLQDPLKPERARVDSIDLLRGIVMVIMMLDHTRDFVHNAALQFDPLDPTRTNVALFFTRWITHFCAPSFVFLAGTGAYLQLARGKSKSELSRFLITRGLWLIVLEVTLVRLGAFWSFDYRLFGMFQVIWVIGVSMIVLAGLIHLPLNLVTAFGAIMVLTHNLLDRPAFRVPSWRGPGTPIPSFGAKVWMLLHQPFEAFPVLPVLSPVIFVVYPLVPWIGVMALGYALGSLYVKDKAYRVRLLKIMGATAIALFVVLRLFDVYGDPQKWSQQSSLVFTVLSFLNTTKYPPSLLFLLMTLGPALLALAYFEKTTVRRENSIGARVRNFFITFGRVPLFFYLLQWPVSHLISFLLHLTFGKPTNWLFQTPMDWFTNPPPPGIGFNLVVVHLSWIAGVLILYPLCKWFAGVKKRRRDWWLSYL
ncbi:MAG TPA: heparan-alpha-glucosaminide N-acetyltransferase domain-containing protein [Pyrinomonadaceae bacterium]|nr:heparan-alpha-glucosaminide N-acetyltransferase domain-containing protein [Pyrinomonadaceae bacterium]